jgi:hypothetical protein
MNLKKKKKNRPRIAKPNTPVHEKPESELTFIKSNGKQQTRKQQTLSTITDTEH